MHAAEYYTARNGNEEPPEMGKLNGSVLVVEDDPEINALVGAYAQLCGLEYRSALDGAQAMQQVNDRAPEIVILDLMLPDIDGFHLCKQWKEHKATREIPVIILTALDGEGDRVKGRACGAVDYLTKPFNPDALMKSITRAVEG